MNNARRKELAEIATQLQDLRERIERLQEEEQDGFDNLSEGLQQTERGQAMELAAGQMSTAINLVEQAVEALEDAQA